MKNKIYLYRSLLLCVIVLSLLVCYARLMHYQAHPAFPDVRLTEKDPLAVTVYNQLDGKSWMIQVDAQGKGSISSIIPYAKPRFFQVSAQNRAQLRQMVNKTHFFQLDYEYGDIETEAGTRLVEIRSGKLNKAVTLWYLGDWEQWGHYKLQAAHDVLKIRSIVTSWASQCSCSDKSPSRTSQISQNEIAPVQ